MVFDQNQSASLDLCAICVYCAFATIVAQASFVPSAVVAARRIIVPDQ
jgi:hypothetical protein